MHEFIKTRNTSIQGLRGLFAIGVLLSHCSFLGNYPSTATAFDLYIGKFANVCFFFMAAGYFMAASFKSETRFGPFLVKKLKRIYPLHVLIWLLIFLLQRVRGEAVTLQYVVKAVTNLLLVQSWIPDNAITNGMNGVAWFLSSLMFCYIAGFFLLKAGNKRKQTALFILTAVLLAIKVAGTFLIPADEFLCYWLTYLCPLAGLCDFLLGMLLFRLVKRFQLSEQKALLLQILSLVLLICMFATKHLLPVNVCRSLYPIPFTFLLLFSFLRETRFSRCVFGNRVMTFLGDLSFEIYLIHLSVITIVSELLPRISVLSSAAERFPYLILLPLVAVVIFSAFLYQKVYIAVLQFITNRRCLHNEKN